MRRQWMLATLSILLLAVGTAHADKDPKQKTIEVDCSKGKSIQDALEDSADDLIVELRGICQEDVVVRRDSVVLRGSDPLKDGIRGTEVGRARGISVIEVLRAKNIVIENIQTSQGGFSGLEVNQSVNVTISNCRSFDNQGHGLAVHGSLFLQGSDLTIVGNRRRGISAFASVNVNCVRCEIDAGSDFGVLAVESTTVGLRQSSIVGAPAIFSLIGGSFVEVDASTLESTSRSMLASAHGEILFTDGSFVGPVSATGNSTIQISNGEQTANLSGANEVGLGSMLALGRDSSLLGEVVAEQFSRVVINEGSTIAGDLSCVSGGDAWCETPDLISGTVSQCKECVKP